MNTKFEHTKDYIEVFNFSEMIASQCEKEFIGSDEIFFGVYNYLKSFDFVDLFWTYMGIKNKDILEQYYNKIYSSNFDFQKEMEKGKLKLNPELESDLDYFADHGFTKLDLLALLYVSSRNLSDRLKKYLGAQGIDTNLFKSKIDNLLKNDAFQKVGTLNLFRVLNKLGDALNLDASKINNIILANVDTSLQTGENNPEIQVEMADVDLTPEGNGDAIGEEAKIDSDIKKDDKKLAIEYFGTDLTKEAQDGFLDPFVGREKEINQLTYTLLRKTKNNPLLIGEAGVGKTAIVEGFAQKIIKGEVSEKLKNKRIFMLDIGSLLAGTKYRGEFEARFKAILEEATDPMNNIILFIDEIHTIIGAGNAEGSADAANMLKPLLSRGKIQLIGSTTFDEYQKHIEKDPALKRRFQEIVVDEPSRDDTITILEGIKDKFEDFHGVNIDTAAIINSIDLSTRYILNKHLPDKAIDLLDEACARKSTLNEKLKNNDEYAKLEEQLKKISEKIEKAIQNQDYFEAAELKEKEEEIKTKLKTLRNQNVLPKHLRLNVEAKDIGQVLAEKLGIPENEINMSEIRKLQNLDNTLKCKILGQEEAVDNVVKSIVRNRLSVVKKPRPIASFLFLGPSGVGKTYMAKLLAKEFFGEEKSLIRVDMSDLMEKHSVSKLIGSAPGYVGYDEGGTLTESVRRKPYSVVLFDEIEKASPDVLNILLQILDEGHLKDNKGRWIDFKNTIIILTSNIGSEEFGNKMAKIGFNISETKNNDFDQDSFEIVKGRVLERLKDYVKPELLNRLDYMIVYRPLGKLVLQGIMRNKIEEFLEKWKEKEGIKIPSFTDKDISKIIDEIYDPAFGARPLERYIYDKIEPDFIQQVMTQNSQVEICEK